MGPAKFSSGHSRSRGFCCFLPDTSASTSSPPPEADQARAYSSKGDVELITRRELHALESRMSVLLNSFKADLAKEMGYPLATRLIHEVSAVFDPNLEKLSLRNQPNPWGWLNRNYEFKKALHDHNKTLPIGMRSVEEIAYKAAQIMAHNNRKFHKSFAEQLYLELKAFNDKGYLDSLKVTDEDLYNFLNLAEFFGNAFIARPRLLQLVTQMLQRVRNELAIYWHTWEKLPFKWNERWHEAESWFDSVLESFKEEKGGQLPGSHIELAREFDFIEESCRRIHGVNQNREPGTFEQILYQYKDMKESGLLTPEVKRQHFMCCAFLELSPQIKELYLANIEARKQAQEDGRKVGRGSSSVSRIESSSSRGSKRSKSPSRKPSRKNSDGSASSSKLSSTSDRKNLDGEALRSTTRDSTSIHKPSDSVIRVDFDTTMGSSKASVGNLNKGSRANVLSLFTQDSSVFKDVSLSSTKWDSDIGDSNSIIPGKGSLSANKQINFSYDRFP